MSTITGKYAKTLIQQQYIKELAVETANDIYNTQAQIAKGFPYSSEVVRILQQRNYSVTSAGRGVRLVLNYPLELRLMDLKYYKNRKKKPWYTPIYNKVLGGFIYGYLYKRLIYGISKQMNEAVTQHLRSAGFNIQ